jgi:hypothetical protein
MLKLSSASFGGKGFVPAGRGITISMRMDEVSAVRHRVEAAMQDSRLGAQG